MEIGRAVDGDGEPSAVDANAWERVSRALRETPHCTPFSFSFFPVNHFTLTLAPLVQSLVINKCY